MATSMTMSDSPTWRAMRWLVWGGAACLLMLPLVAMQFTSEVDWTLSDFIVMGAMLGLACGAFELAVRVGPNHAYVMAMGLAAATAFLTAWVNLAVGIVGNEDNPANAMFFGVLAIGLIAATVARLKPLQMARAMQVTAAAQAIVSVAAFVMAPDQRVGWLFSAVLAAMWLTSALLFRNSARKEGAAHSANA